MSKKPSTGTVGRLGVRYGRTVRMRLGQIEAELRKKHPCPSCGSRRVKRKSVGVWRCAKCSLVFSGGAYRPSSNTGEVAKRSAKKSA